MYESAVKSRNAKNNKNIKNRKKNVAKKLRKNKLGFIPMAAIAIIVTLLSINLWNNWITINKNKEQIAALTQERNHKRIKNDATQQKVDSVVDDEYVIDVARKNGYRNSDEIIFYFNNAGD